MKFLYLFLTLLGVSIVFFCSNNKEAQQIKLRRERIEKVEFFYVPNNTRMETSMNSDFLKDTTNRIVSYFCVSNVDTLMKFEKLLAFDNFIKPSRTIVREPFSVIRITYIDGASFEFSKGRLTIFSLDNESYFNSDLNIWMNDNLFDIENANRMRVYCQ